MMIHQCHLSQVAWILPVTLPDYFHHQTFHHHHHLSSDDNNTIGTTNEENSEHGVLVHDNGGVTINHPNDNNKDHDNMTTATTGEEDVLEFLVQKQWI